MADNSTTTRKIYEVDIQVGDAYKRMAELTVQINRLQETMKGIAQVSGTNSEEYQRLSAQVRVLRDEYRAAERFAKNSIKMDRQKEGSLNNLRTAYNLLNQQIGELGTTQEEVAKKDALVKQASELNALISEQEQAFGNYKRNVGNYGSAFNGLNVQIQQLARELPSLTVSTSQFFLAISNNLPMLFDEISKMKMQNAQLRAEGKAAPSVFKALGSALFSWQTALSVGVLLLTQYGGELVKWIGQLLSGKGALDAASMAAEQFNEAMEQGVRNSIEDVTRLRILYEAANDVTRSIEERTAAAIELQETYPQTFAMYEQEEIMNGRAAKSYTALTDAIIERAKAKAMEGMMIENATKAYEKELKAQKQRAKLEKWEDDDSLWRRIWVSDERMEWVEKRAEHYEKRASKFNAANAELYKLLDTEALTSDPTAPLEEAVEEAVETPAKAVEETAKEVEQARNDILKQLKDFAKGVDNLRTKSYEEQAGELMAQYSAARAKLLTLEPPDLTGLDEEEAAAAMDVYNKLFAERMYLYYDLIDNENAALEELRQKQKQAELQAAQDLNSSIINATKEGSTQRLAAELALMQAQLEIRRRYGDDVTELEQQIADQITAIRQSEIDAQYDVEVSSIMEGYRLKREKLAAELELYRDNAEKVKDITEELRATETEATLEIMSIVSEYGSQLFDGVTNLVSAFGERLEEAAETQYDALEQSLADAYARGLYTEAEYNAESIRLEQEKAARLKEIRREQAIAEKAASIFQIGIDTATALVKVWADTPTLAAPAMSALIAASAALQLATVLATPIPTAATGRYIHGNSHAQGGELIEAEAGEVIINRRSAAMFLPLLSAINQAGGGVPFGSQNWMPADGGYSSRRAVSGDDIDSRLVKALEKVQIVATIKDIQREEANYIRIQNGGRINKRN